MGLLSAAALTTVLTSLGSAPAHPISYRSFKTGYVYYHAVLADMSKDQVTAEAFYADKLTNAWKMIGVRQPAAAITGTFFGYKSEQPIADVVVDGKLMARGHRGSAVAVDWYGKVHIFDTPFKEEVDWYSYKHMLRGAIRLIRNGNIQPDPKSQHFTDPRLWGKAP